MNGVWAVVIIKLYPFADPGFGLPAAAPGMQINTFIFEGPPKPFDEDVVHEAAFAIHGDFDPGFA